MSIFWVNLYNTGQEKKHRWKHRGEHMADVRIEKLAESNTNR
jgi:hypothetical protein